MQDKDDKMHENMISLETRDQARVTYTPLIDRLSNFEIAFLSFQKAIEIIRSAAYLSVMDQKSKYKPKVAVIAFEYLCTHTSEALQLKQSIMESMCGEAVDETKYDTYNVDEGHLPKNGEIS